MEGHVTLVCNEIKDCFAGVAPAHRAGETGGVGNRYIIGVF